MANNFLIFGMLAALGWVFANGSPPSTEPMGRLAASRDAVTDFSMTSYATSGRSPVLEARRDPVPLVRNVRTSPASSTLPEPPVVDAEAQAQDGLDRKAAKAADELDGYKRVTVLGEGSNGTWRAKAYRGTTEVLLRVEGTGINGMMGREVQLRKI